MSCCRDGVPASDDVLFYRKLDDVALALANSPDRFRADLAHTVKGPKLRRLLEALQYLGQP